MTIYDQDYMAELAAQNQATSGVKDSAAENQEAVPQDAGDHNEQALEMVHETSQDQVADVSTPISDKEMNFKALREELALMKTEKDRLARDFEDIKRSNVQRQTEPPRKRAIDELNDKDDSDLVTVAQFKQIMFEREAEHQKQLYDQQSNLQELSHQSKYSDYDEVTSKYGVPLIENEPDLAQGFMGAQNKASYLYKISKMAKHEADYQQLIQEQRVQRQEQQAPQPSQTAQRIVENARKPGTLSNAVGGSGNLSKADYIASMSDAEFHAYVQKNLQEI